MKRSLNKVMLIGNLTKAPELRYTPQGTGVASFVIATNREWKVEGSTKEAADFHNVVAWNRLAEICSQLLTKGTKVYVEGRLQTRNWESEGSKKYKTEVVIDQMFVLAGANPNADAGLHDELDGNSEHPTGEHDVDDILSELEEGEDK